MCWNPVCWCDTSGPSQSELCTTSYRFIRDLICKLYFLTLNYICTVVRTISRFATKSAKLCRPNNADIGFTVDVVLYWSALSHTDVLLKHFRLSFSVSLSFYFLLFCRQPSNTDHQLSFSLDELPGTGPLNQHFVSHSTSTVPLNLNCTLKADENYSI